MSEIRVTLPGFPPSTNHLYATVRGRRVKTKAYRTWRAGAAMVIRAEAARQDGWIYHDPYYVQIEARGLNRNRDLDNIVKPILDAVVESGAIVDDRWFDHVLAYRVLPCETEETVITVGLVG